MSRVKSRHLLIILIFALIMGISLASCRDAQDGGTAVTSEITAVPLAVSSCPGGTLLQRVPGDTTDINFQNYSLLQGMVDVELWSEWQAGKLEKLSGDVTGYNISILHPELKEPFNTRLLSSIFEYQTVADGWDLVVEKINYLGKQGAWPENNIHVRKTYAAATHDNVLLIDVDNFRIEDVSEDEQVSPPLKGGRGDFVSAVFST